ncbi:hypothetical protein AJ80_03183 [Polytolypa hystricis UAMH7299]|uniref:Uncharacterized protein n=1 Tax=Polytolypa hystricis (strain UAMH7299) TaxID=1447883 RepID=A0A2B7YJM6_POLH7|nr:hypothetical protein AJ80_03183 [Polytolypa hystricis UAMH7299]
MDSMRTQHHGSGGSAAAVLRGRVKMAQGIIEKFDGIVSDVVDVGEMMVSPTETRNLTNGYMPKIMSETTLPQNVISILNRLRLCVMVNKFGIGSPAPFVPQRPNKILKIIPSHRLQSAQRPRKVPVEGAHRPPHQPKTLVMAQTMGVRSI